VLGSKRGAVAHIGAVSEEIRPAEAQRLVGDVVSKLSLLVSVLGLS
jgi:hypothetical protein